MAATESTLTEVARATVSTAVIASTGPLLADYASLAIAGSLGALIKIGSTPAISSSWSQVMWSLAIGMALAVLFGAFGAAHVADWLGDDKDTLMIPVAGMLGLIGKDWLPVLKWVWEQRSAIGIGTRRGGNA